MNGHNGAARGFDVPVNGVAVATVTCPTCDSPISKERYDRIFRLSEARQKQLAEEQAAIVREREKLAAERTAIAKDAVAKEREKSQAEAAKAARDVERVQKKAETDLEKLARAHEKQLQAEVRKREAEQVQRTRQLAASDAKTKSEAEAREHDPKRAFAWLTAEREKIKRGVDEAETRSMPTWRSYAASVFRAKVDDGSIQSAKGREKWGIALEHHLFTAPWASYYVDKIKHADLVEWRNALPARTWERRNKKGELIKSGDYAANTMNDWLAIARVIFASATIKYDLARDPMVGIDDFVPTHRTYTREQPNALPPEIVAKWLATFKASFPQFYAMVFLGLVHGKRPSALRPLRRKGPERDVDVAAAHPRLLVRRSHTLRAEVWEQTKTKHDLDLKLHPRVVEVLRWHVNTQLVTDAQLRSDLLFPSKTGGFRSKSCLDKPFARVTAACRLSMRITPRALRRTFQDLTRAGKIDGVVAKAISGHATDAMRVHYSTAQDAEVERAVGVLVDLATVRANRNAKKRRTR